MNKLEKGLLKEAAIPLKAAADFFIDIRQAKVAHPDKPSRHLAKLANCGVTAGQLAKMRKLAADVEDSSMTAASNPDAQQAQPTNFLQAEMIAQQAQNGQEAAFYRTRAQMAQQQAQQLQQEIAATQQQLQSVQEQASSAGSQLQQYTEQAMQAQDEALQQTQMAAQMRLGIQKLRAQMMEVTSQDPLDVGAQEMTTAPAVEGMPGQPDQMEATPGAELPAQAAPAASEGAPGLGAPPQTTDGSGAAGAQPATAEPSQLKAGSAGALLSTIPGAIAGAGLGIAAHNKMRTKGPELQERIKGLEANENSFFNALRLASAKQQAALASFAESNPEASKKHHMATGAITGALAAPTITKSLGSIIHNSKSLLKG